VAQASAEFKSITGIEPFDFDFNALDRLVHSGDERRPSSEGKIASADLAASAKAANDLLSKNLPARTLVSRSPSAEAPQESISRSMNSIPAFKPLPRSITDAFEGL